MDKIYKSDEFARRRKERKRQAQKRMLKRFFTFFVIIALAVVTVLSFTVFFPIKNITTKGSSYYTNSEIIDATKIEVGDNLLSVSQKNTLKKIRKKLPFVQEIDFERILPDSLHIKVTDAVEYNCYKVGEKYYSVGADGFVLKVYAQKPENLTVITCEKVKCSVGSLIVIEDKNSSEVIPQIIKCLHSYNMVIDELDVTDRININAKINGKFTVVFGTVADIEPKIKHLNSMIANIPENKHGKIDLSMWSLDNPQAIFVDDNMN